MTAELPDFVEPMLARIGAPFDSDQHAFEIKWDGMRALSFVEGGAYRLLNRRRNDCLARYPELDFLRGLPRGSVLDGELVRLVDGRPDFQAVMGREHARGARRIRELARSQPVTYAVFDLLYSDFESVLDRPLVERRARLAETVAGCQDAALVLSEFVTGAGRHYFEQVCSRGLEGVVAKRLASPYRPGQRGDDWTKIKRVHHLNCVVIGYVPDGERDLKSLIIAADDEHGTLRCVGKVGSGLRESTRRSLFERLRSRPRETPLVACEFDGRWVEPGLFCLVSYLERTRSGALRAPVFVELIE